MNCRTCKYDFCWMCMEVWSGHQSYFNCKKYEEMKDKNEKVKKELNEIEKARQELERYAFHFERYNTHLNGQKTAVKQLPEFQEKADKLQEEKDIPLMKLHFIAEAFKEIQRCR